MPVSYDPALYLYAGWILLHGGTPYVDSCCAHGPANHLLFAAIRLVSGTSTVRLQIVLVIAAALAAAALGAYLRRRAGSAAGLTGALLLAVLAATPALEGSDPNTEQLGIAPMAAAWLLAAHPGLYPAAGAGAVAALTVLVNPGLAVVALIVTIELLSRSRGDRIRAVVAAVMGASAVVAMAVAVLGAVHALDDMRDQMLGYAASGLELDGLGERLSAPVSDLFAAALSLPARGLWAAGVAGAIIALSLRHSRRAAAVALAWIVLSWIRVKSADYSFPHHYYPALPGIAAGIALGLAALPLARVARILTTAAVAVALAWTYVLDDQVQALASPPTARFGLNPGHPYVLARPLAEFIKEHTGANSRLYVAGGLRKQGSVSAAGEPGVYWLAERRSITRFIASFAYGRQPSGYLAERAAALRLNAPSAVVAMPGIEPNRALRNLLQGDCYALSYTYAGARVWLQNCPTP